MPRTDPFVWDTVVPCSAGRPSGSAEVVVLSLKVELVMNEAKSTYKARSSGNMPRLSPSGADVEADVVMDEP